MQQLLLDLFTPPPPRLDNFVTGNNAELVGQLNQLLADSLPAPSLFMYGPHGCGKSHLLKAVAEQLGVPLLSGRSGLGQALNDRVVVIDDIDGLQEADANRLMLAINQARHERHPRVILMAATQPASSLPLRPDLTSRIEWGLTYRVQPLNEQQKKQALCIAAQERGLKLGDDVLSYVLSRFQRDMGSLSAVIDGLDRFSLEHHKPVSIHLLRSWMRRREGIVIRNS